MPMTKLVKNPLQQGHCKDAFTLLHFYNRVMGHTVLVTFLWCVIRHKQKVNMLVRLCASFGEMCPLGGMVGRGGFLSPWCPPMPRCWAGTFLAQV